MSIAEYAHIDFFRIVWKFCQNNVWAIGYKQNYDELSKKFIQKSFLILIRAWAKRWDFTRNPDFTRSPDFIRKERNKRSKINSAPMPRYIFFKYEL